MYPTYMTYMHTIYLFCFWGLLLMPKSVIDLLYGWRNLFGNHYSFCLESSPFMPAMDTVERERKNCTFEDMEISVVQLKLSSTRYSLKGPMFWALVTIILFLSDCNWHYLRFFRTTSCIHPVYVREYLSINIYFFFVDK